MNLATAVIRSTADKNTASLFLQETKSVKALLKQYEARGYMMVDVLQSYPTQRLQTLLQGNSRRKDFWIYHHLGPWDPQSWEEIKGQLNGVKLLYISGSITQEQLSLFFDEGIPVVLTTGSHPYGTSQLLFARKLYANLSAGARLEDAFEQARIYVEMEQKQAIQKPVLFSQWGASQSKEAGTVPWGLYYNDPGASSLSFSLPQRGNIQLPGKNEQRAWLLRQRFKDVFLEGWGASQHQLHFLTIMDGPVGMGNLCQVVREEICLPYQYAGVRVLKIDFAASLEEAQIKLLTQLKQAMGIYPELGDDWATDVSMGKDGMVFLLKIFQSEWPGYGAQLFEWLKRTALPIMRGAVENIDLIFLCTLIADRPESDNKDRSVTSLKRIVDACKALAPSEWIDFRL
jgi:hypothetical protein